MQTIDVSWTRQPASVPFSSRGHMGEIGAFWSGAGQGLNKDRRVFREYPETGIQSVKDRKVWKDLRVTLETYTVVSTV